MSVFKVLDITKPFKNGCGYRNGKLEDIEEFMQCAITLASVINPQLAIVKYGVMFINATKELKELEETAEELQEVVESVRKQSK